MSNNGKELVKTADAPIEWGNREEIVALGNRLKAMMPGDLSNDEALLLAQYAAATDANPFRGEIYAYSYKGKMVLTEGYKLLVRWARRQCNFYERYEELDGDELPEAAIGYRCRILREDAVEDLVALTKAGVENAYEMISTEAVGVVTKADMTTRDGRPNQPPTGWTWQDVARKRALKNCINRAYGSPSPREIAEESWRLDQADARPEDWGIDEALPAEAQAKLADRRRDQAIPAEPATRGRNKLFKTEAPRHRRPAMAVPVEPPEEPAVIEDATQRTIDAAGDQLEGMVDALEAGGILEVELEHEFTQGRDPNTIKTFGDLWTATRKDFNLTKSAALKELGVKRQQDLVDHPRDLYGQIAAVVA